MSIVQYWVMKSDICFVWQGIAAKNRNKKRKLNVIITYQVITQIILVYIITMCHTFFNKQLNYYVIVMIMITSF